MCMGLAVRQIGSNREQLQCANECWDDPENPELGFRYVQAELEQVKHRAHDDELTDRSVSPHE